MNQYVLEVNYSDNCTYSYNETHSIEYAGDIKSLEKFILASIKKRSVSEKPLKIGSHEFNHYDLMLRGEKRFKLYTLEDWFITNL